MPDDNEVPSDELKGDDRVLQHFMVRDNEVICAEKESAEGILSNWNIPCNKNCLFEETGDILLFNKRKYEI